MPGHLKTKKKKRPTTKPELKLPTDKLKLCPAEVEDDSKVDEKIRDFCDELMQSEWRSYISRPKQLDMFGVFVISQYYVQEKMWVVLYVGKGRVSRELDKIFTGRSGEAISHYMVSFPKKTVRSKDQKTLVWLKWLPDPFFPYESLNVADVIAAIAKRYNCGETPAFNATEKELLPPDSVPEDFSILPGWTTKKSKSKKKKAI